MHRVVGFPKGRNEARERERPLLPFREGKGKTTSPLGKERERPLLLWGKKGKYHFSFGERKGKTTSPFGERKGKTTSPLGKERERPLLLWVRKGKDHFSFG